MSNGPNFTLIFLAAALCAAIAHIEFVPIAFLVLALLNDGLRVWASRDTDRTVEDEF